MTTGKNQGINIELTEDRVIVSIGIETLAVGATIDSAFRVINTRSFAAEVVDQLAGDEDEEGSTLADRMFLEAARLAMEVLGDDVVVDRDSDDEDDE